MKVGIMQPYFFPYLGYWQLINAVDQYVLLDDVNFITRGYINRNSILINGAPHKFSISLQKPSQNKLICETKLNFPLKERHSFLKMVEMAYKKAKYFEDIYPEIEKIVLFDEDDLTGFIENSIKTIQNYIGGTATILRSSKIEKDTSLKAQARIIEINKKLGATHYINAIGGQALYDKESFYEEGIDLKFIKMLPIAYQQYENTFVPNLSIIDVLMFNSRQQVQVLLNQYELI